MLPRPSIFKTPKSTYPYYNGNMACYDSSHQYDSPNKTCSYYEWHCQPYHGDCIDASYCGYTLTGGAVVTAGVAIGIAVFAPT